MRKIYDLENLSSRLIYFYIGAAVWWNQLSNGQFPGIYVPTCHCFSSAPTHWFFSGKVPLLIPHCCDQEFNHQSFPPEKQIKIKTLIVNLSKKKKAIKSRHWLFKHNHISHPGCFWALLWHQDGFQYTQLSVWSFGTRGISTASSLRNCHNLFSTAMATLFVENQFRWFMRVKQENKTWALKRCVNKDVWGWEREELRSIVISNLGLHSLPCESSIPNNVGQHWRGPSAKCTRAGLSQRLVMSQTLWSAAANKYTSRQTSSAQSKSRK